MNRIVWLAGAGAWAMLTVPALGQTVPIETAPVADLDRQGVLVFEPAFFADARPDTALDMIARLPGFNLDRGNSDTRGLAGTAGNVLIDGARLTRLMIDHGVGCRVEETLYVKKLDDEFFEF